MHNKVGLNFQPLTRDHLENPPNATVKDKNTYKFFDKETYRNQKSNVLPSDWKLKCEKLAFPSIETILSA